MFHSIEIRHTRLTPSDTTTDKIVVTLDNVVIPYQNFGTPPPNESWIQAPNSNFFLDILNLPTGVRTPPKAYSDVQIEATRSLNQIGARYVTLTVGGPVQYPNLTVDKDCYEVSLIQDSNVNFPQTNIVLSLKNVPNGNDPQTTTASDFWNFAGTSAVDGPICNFIQTNLGFVSTSITPGACCVAKGSLVATTTGYTPIENLRLGQQLLDYQGNPTELVQLVRFNQPTAKTIRIPPGALGDASPDRTLNILPGHPLLIDGREVMPEELVGQRGVTMERSETPCFVYTLLTERRTFVNVQNCQIGTWSYDSWLNFSDNSNRFGHWTFAAN